MSTGRIDALADRAKRSRDLGSAELWERSLARSRQRRRLADLNRRHRRRRKTVSLAVSASVAGGPILPTAVAAAESGPGSGADAASAAVAQSSSAKVVLELGSRGALVASLQRRLDEVLPFSHLAVDGIFGPLTRGAVADYQRRHGFLADGKVDAGLWARMFDAPVLVFGSTGSSQPGTASRHGAGAAPARGASPGHSRAKHGALDGGAGLTRRGGGRATTTPGAPRSAAAGSGGSLVAGGPGTATTPGRSGNGTGSAGGAGSAGGTGSGGGSGLEVVAPVAPTTTQFSTYVLTNGVALPLPRQYLVGGSVDQGVDYAAPGGTPEYAMGDGVIIGEGISGFGPNAPILKITSGPLTGLEIYYGHAGTNLVRVGQHVKAGQQITQVGYGIVGISTGPHLEIGFYPPGHMGAGSKMLSVINSLLKQHRSGRVWASSTTTSAHVARDSGTRSVTPVRVTAAAGTSAATASSGGAAVGSDAVPETTVPASAPPSAPTPAPTSEQPQPVTAPAPVEANSAPTEAPAAPPEATSAPPEATGAPTDATSAPTEATGAPTEATGAPTDATSAPTDAAPTTDAATAPSSTTSTPAAAAPSSEPTTTTSSPAPAPATSQDAASTTTASTSVPATTTATTPPTTTVTTAATTTATTAATTTVTTPAPTTSP